MKAYQYYDLVVRKEPNEQIGVIECKDGKYVLWNDVENDLKELSDRRRS